MLSSLVDKSNKLFQSLSKKKYISEKYLKYFTYNNKNATTLGKLYFLPKIHKRLFNVPGRPVISNCGTPTEKVSEYLDFCLKPIMQNGWSYVKDSSDFKHKIKKLGKLYGNITLVTADVVALYPSVPHEDGLETLRERLIKIEDLKLPISDISINEFVLKNNIFELNGKFKQQFAGTAIGTKFAPSYACIYMDEVETEFLKTQELQPLIWFRYIDDMFLYGVIVRMNLTNF